MTKGTIYGCDLSTGRDYTVKVWGHIEKGTDGREKIVIDRQEVEPPKTEGLLMEIEVKESLA